MTALFSLLEAALAVPLALSNPTDITAIVAPTPYEESTPTSRETDSEIVFIPSEVVQELPDYSASWLDGRASFVGGELTTSERQYTYARANNLPFMRTEADYWESVRNGHFITLRHPSLVVAARRPHVLPATAKFIYGVAERFQAASCGRIRVNDAMRLTGIQPPNASIFSVHAVGMALDLRVSDLSPRCDAILSSLLHEGEVAGLADSTREHWRTVNGVRVPNPHFHIVVVATATRSNDGRVYMDMQYDRGN